MKLQIIDTDCNDNPTCPYCGDEKHKWDFLTDTYRSLQNGQIQVECDNCQEQYIAHVSFTVSFSSSFLSEQAAIKHYRKISEKSLELLKLTKDILPSLLKEKGFEKESITIEFIHEYLQGKREI